MTDTVGPVEAWMRDHCMHVTEQAGMLSWWIPWGSASEEARKIDAQMAALTEALEEAINEIRYLGPMTRATSFEPKVTRLTEALRSVKEGEG